LVSFPKPEEKVSCSISFREQARTCEANSTWATFQRQRPGAFGRRFQQVPMHRGFMPRDLGNCAFLTLLARGICWRKQLPRTLTMPWRTRRCPRHGRRSGTTRNRRRKRRKPPICPVTCPAKTICGSKDVITRPSRTGQKRWKSTGRCGRLLQTIWTTVCGLLKCKRRGAWPRKPLLLWPRCETCHRPLQTIRGLIWRRKGRRVDYPISSGNLRRRCAQQRKGRSWVRGSLLRGQNWRRGALTTAWVTCNISKSPRKQRDGFMRKQATGVVRPALCTIWPRDCTTTGNVPPQRRCKKRPWKRAARLATGAAWRMS